MKKFEIYLHQMGNFCHLLFVIYTHATRADLSKRMGFKQYTTVDLSKRIGFKCEL